MLDLLKILGLRKACAALLIVLIDGMVCAPTIRAQGINVVKEYGDNLTKWSETGRAVIYREKISDLCNGKKSTRVDDDIAMSLGRNSGISPSNGSYLLDSYLDFIQNAINIEDLSIKFSNFHKEKNSDIVAETKKATKFAQKEDKEYVSCHIQMDGSLEYDVHDLFVIRDGKISKITKYEVDSRTKKIKVDLSDIMPEQTFGISYNYGKNWPIGASFSYSYSMFMISLDAGFNTDNDKVHKQKLEMTDVMNFTKEDIELDPMFFVTATPALYMKYFSVGCGFGIMYMDGKRVSYTANAQPAQSHVQNEGSSVFSFSGNNYVHSMHDGSSKVKLMLRPTLKGYIPLNDELYLSLSVGYDYVFGYKDKNGLNFGLGVQVEL